jgi:hypothetical protein
MQEEQVGEAPECALACVGQSATQTRNTIFTMTTPFVTIPSREPALRG